MYTKWNARQYKFENDKIYIYTDAYLCFICKIHTIDAYALASPTLTNCARFKSVVFEKIQNCSAGPSERELTIVQCPIVHHTNDKERE